MLRVLLLLLATSGAVELHDGWQYAATAPRATPPGQNASWSDAVEPEPGQDVWYRVPLPSAIPSEPHLVFRTYAPRLEIFVDQRRVYTIDDPEARGAFRLHVVPLGAAAGRTLFIRVPEQSGNPTLGGAPMVVTTRDVPLALAAKVREPLLSDLDDVIVGISLTIVGLFSFVISRLRRSSTAGALLWFGVFTALYGLRLLVGSVLPALAGMSLRQLDFAEAAITYVITIPGWLLAREFVGNGWRQTLRLQVIAFACFAAIGLVSDWWTGVPESLRAGNNLLVIIGGLNLVLNLFYARPRHARELRVVSYGAVVFLLFALVNNLSALGVLPWDGVDETLGFVVFVATLGYAAARSFLRGERERVAIEGELATAREIQHSILPAAMPQISGLSVQARYVPATSVAGDLYDFVATDTHSTGLLVADVAGHGVPAALIASMVKVAVSSQQHAAAEPHAVLGQLNRILKNEVRRAFVTATFLHFDMREPRVRISNAGHPSPLLLRDGEFRELGVHGVLLGRFGEATYTSEEIELQSGDRIVAWTDGIVEAFNRRGEAFGENRLKEILRTRRDAGDAVIDAVLAWRDRDSDADDLTIVIVDVQR